MIIKIEKWELSLDEIVDFIGDDNKSKEEKKKNKKKKNKKKKPENQLETRPEISTVIRLKPNIKLEHELEAQAILKDICKSIEKLMQD